jgi:hypothetical protein
LSRGIDGERDNDAPAIRLGRQPMPFFARGKHGENVFDIQAAGKMEKTPVPPRPPS